jgi:hypothetical protein
VTLISFVCIVHFFFVTVQAAVATHDGIKVVVTAMNTHPNEADLQLEGCAVLCNLSNVATINEANNFNSHLTFPLISSIFRLLTILPFF